MRFVAVAVVFIRYRSVPTDRVQLVVGCCFRRHRDRLQAQFMKRFSLTLK